MERTEAYKLALTMHDEGKNPAEITKALYKRGYRPRGHNKELSQKSLPWFIQRARKEIAGHKPRPYKKTAVAVSKPHEIIPAVRPREPFQQVDDKVMLVFGAPSQVSEILKTLK